MRLVLSEYKHLSAFVCTFWYVSPARRGNPGVAFAMSITIETLREADLEGALQLSTRRGLEPDGRRLAPAPPVGAGGLLRGARRRTSGRHRHDDDLRPLAGVDRDDDRASRRSTAGHRRGADDASARPPRLRPASRASSWTPRRRDCRSIVASASRRRCCSSAGWASRDRPIRRIPRSTSTPRSTRSFHSTARRSAPTDRSCSPCSKPTRWPRTWFASPSRTSKGTRWRERGGSRPISGRSSVPTAHSRRGLLDALLSRFAGRQVCIDVNTGGLLDRDRLVEGGLASARPLMRMRRGGTAASGTPRRSVRARGRSTAKRTAPRHPHPQKRKAWGRQPRRRHAKYLLGPPPISARSA